MLRFFLLGGFEEDSDAGEFSDRNVGGLGDFGAASRDNRASCRFSGRKVEAEADAAAEAVRSGSV